MRDAVPEHDTIQASLGCLHTTLYVATPGIPTGHEVFFFLFFSILSSFLLGISPVGGRLLQECCMLWIGVRGHIMIGFLGFLFTALCFWGLSLGLLVYSFFMSRDTIVLYGAPFLLDLLISGPQIQDGMRSRHFTLHLGLPRWLPEVLDPLLSGSRPNT